MQYFMITVQGQNRIGIVSDVTQVLFEQNVNITDSNMTTLRSEFVMMLMAELPDESDPMDFFHGINTLKKKDLTVFVKPLNLEEAQPLQKHLQPTHTISILGEDHVGIVYQISTSLSLEKINITDVNTQVINASNKNLYAMVLEIVLPENIDEAAFSQTLKQLANDINVDLNFQSIQYAEM